MVYHAGYAGVQAPSARERIADAWRAGHAAKGSNISTDGSTVTSYGWHTIAVTLSDGTKVAFDCHYSPTTTKQSGPTKVAADYVIPCQTCGIERGARTLLAPRSADVVTMAAECLKFAHCDYHKTVWCLNASDRKHYGSDMVCPMNAPDVRRCQATYGYVARYDRG